MASRAKLTSIWEPAVTAKLVESGLDPDDAKKLGIEVVTRPGVTLVTRANMEEPQIAALLQPPIDE